MDFSKPLLVVTPREVTSILNTLQPVRSRLYKKVRIECGRVIIEHGNAITEIFCSNDKKRRFEWSEDHPTDEICLETTVIATGVITSDVLYIYSDNLTPIDLLTSLMERLSGPRSISTRLSYISGMAEQTNTLRNCLQP